MSSDAAARSPSVIAKKESQPHSQSSHVHACTSSRSSSHLHAIHCLLRLAGMAHYFGLARASPHVHVHSSPSDTNMNALKDTVGMQMMCHQAFFKKSILRVQPLQSVRAKHKFRRSLSDPAAWQWGRRQGLHSTCYKGLCWRGLHPHRSVASANILLWSHNCELVLDCAAPDPPTCRILPDATWLVLPDRASVHISFCGMQTQAFATLCHCGTSQLQPGAGQACTSTLPASAHFTHTAVQAAVQAAQSTAAPRRCRAGCRWCHPRKPACQGA